MPWCDCHAKSTKGGSPGQSVHEHCSDVAEVARALVDELASPVSGLLGSNPVAVAATHDIGKVSPGFQLKYFRESVREHLPQLAAHSLENYATGHAAISEAAVNAHLSSEARGTRLGAVLGAHHGRRAEPGRDDHGVYGGATWAAERQALIRRLSEEFGSLDDNQLLDPHVLAGFVCVADWIGSDERFFPAAGLGPRVDRAALARQAVGECGWQPPRLVSDLTFEQVFGFAPRPLQRDFVDAVDGPGVYVLEAPMGSGKTEAALYAAYRLISRKANSGLYFALPTRLTSDKIHERVRDFLSKIAEGDVDVRLAHGDAWLRAFQSGGGELAPGQGWFGRPNVRCLCRLPWVRSIRRCSPFSRSSTSSCAASGWPARSSCSMRCTLTTCTRDIAPPAGAASS